MTAPKDDGERLHAVMVALADSAAAASDKDLLDDAAREGIDAKAVGSQVRSLLLAGLQKVRRSRLRDAQTEYERAAHAFSSRVAELPADPATRRALLGRTLARKPKVREAVLTLQHREFESLSDGDVESLLQQLQHLGALDEPDPDPES